MSILKLTLSELQPAEKARVTGYCAGCDAAYRRTLMSRGVLPASEITVIRTAPLGDPMEISVRDYRLTLRRQEAACVLVERL